MGISPLTGVDYETQTLLCFITLPRIAKPKPDYKLSKEEKPLAVTALDSAPGLIFWKDINSIYQGGNSQTLDILELGTQKDLAEKTDHDLQWHSNAEIYRTNDKEVIETGKAILREEVTIIHGQEKTFLANKMPLRNADGKIIGVIANSIDISNFEYAQRIKEKEKHEAIIKLVQQCTDISEGLPRKFNELLFQSSFAQQIIKLANGDYELSHQCVFEGQKLSERETECLFYLARGKTAKMIARILGLSYRTVESHLENIKNKLGDCYTKADLIDKALSGGFLTLLPTQLFFKILQRRV